MEYFEADWGLLAYIGAAGWAFFEGESFVLLAAAAGRAACVVNPWILIGSAWLGSYAGDQLWFVLGRRYGVRAVRRVCGAEKRLAAATRFVEHYGDLFVLGFRFVYGIRNVSAAACGITGMNHIRFAVLNFIAAGIWASSFVAAGWYLEAWLGRRGIGWAIGLFGLAFLLGLVWKYRRSHHPDLIEPAGITQR